MILLNEYKSLHEQERLLRDLFDYLSQEPTDDIYDNDGSLNPLYKAYNYFEPKAIVRDEWCVHFTNAEGYEGINKDGFVIGVSNYDELAYSATYYGDGTKRGAGWNFALPVDAEYLGEDRGYGDFGFVLCTDGVRAYHRGDGNDEIIFQGCHVKKKVPFYYDDEYDCWVPFMDIDSDNPPDGSYYEDELGQVVFEDIETMVRFIISVNRL